MFKSSEVKLITTLALPLAAAFLAQKGMQIVDTIMMGWLGPQALAAAALGTSLFITVVIFGMGTLSAVGVFIAHAKGAGRHVDIRSYLQHGCCLAFIMWMMFFCLWYYSEKHPLLKSYNTFLKIAEFDWQKIKALFRLGVSSGLISVMDASMFTVAAMMMGHFGVSALAAHQITMQCVMAVFGIPFSLSIAAGLQVGHCAGAGNYQQAQRYAYLTLMMGLSTSFIAAILFLVFPQSIAKLFLASGTNHYLIIENLTTTFLTIAALFQCCDALQIIMSGALKGLKDTFIPMLLSIGCYWLCGIGSAYYFAFHTHLGAAGIWYGLTLGICSIGIILFCRFLLRNNKILSH